MFLKNLSLWKRVDIKSRKLSWNRENWDISLNWENDAVCHQKGPSSGAQPEIFQDRGGFVKLGHLINFLSKSQEKRLRGEKVWSFFS